MEIVLKEDARRILEDARKKVLSISLEVMSSC